MEDDCPARPVNLALRPCLWEVLLYAAPFPREMILPCTSGSGQKAARSHLDHALALIGISLFLEYHSLVE